MSRSGCPRGGARRVRAERGPARRAAGVLPARSGRPCSGPGRSDRRRACGAVRAPSPGALPGRGLPGGCDRRPPGPARRGVGAGNPGRPVLVPHALGPRSDGDQFRLIFVTSGTATPPRPTSRSTTPSCRSKPRRGTWPSGPYSSQFRVVGSTAAVDARDNTKHHRDRGADLLAERQQGRRQLRGLLRRRGWDDEANPRDSIGAA